MTQGLKVLELGLHFGGNDVGSVMLEENVVKAAGTSNCTTEEELRRIIRDAGFKPVQRDTLYPDDVFELDLSAFPPRVLHHKPTACGRWYAGASIFSAMRRTCEKSHSVGNEWVVAVGRMRASVQRCAWHSCGAKWKGLPYRLAWDTKPPKRMRRA